VDGGATGILSTPEAAPVAASRAPALGVRAHLVALALAVLLPTWGLAGYVAYRLAEAERSTLAAEGRQAARAVATSIELEAATLRASLVALATSPALDAGDLGAFQRQAREIQAQLGTRAVLLGPEDRLLADSAQPDAAAPAGAASLPLPPGDSFAARRSFSERSP